MQSTSKIMDKNRCVQSKTLSAQLSSEATTPISSGTRTANSTPRKHSHRKREHATKSLHVETFHQDRIHDARMNFLGTMLATASSDRTVRVFAIDMKSRGREHIATLEGHSGPVWQVAWGHPMYGQILASCSFDGTVIIWREFKTKTVSPNWNKPNPQFQSSPLLLSSTIEGKNEQRYWGKSLVLNNQKCSVNSVDWSPPEYGILLAYGCTDGNICIVTIEDFEAPKWNNIVIKDTHKLGCNSISWCPAKFDDTCSDDSTIPKRFVSGGNDYLLRIWKHDEFSNTWMEEHVLEGSSDWIRDVAWSPNTLKIASASADKRVFVWTFQETTNSWKPETVSYFDDVYTVNWSCYSGELLVVSEGDSNVTLWKSGDKGRWDLVKTETCIEKNKRGMEFRYSRRNQVNRHALSF